MLQSTVLAIKGAQLVIDCAGITAGKNVIIMCDKDRWLEGEALAGVCHAVGVRPLLVDLSPQVAWYEGRIAKVSGGENGDRFRRFLKESGENAEAICEVGIITSHLEKQAYEYLGRPGHRACGGWGARSGRYPFQARFSHFSGRNGCRNLFRSSGADDGCQRWCPYDR